MWLIFCNSCSYSVVSIKIYLLFAEQRLLIFIEDKFRTMSERKVALNDLIITLESSDELFVRSNSSGKGILASPFVIFVLSYCKLVRTRKEIVELLGEEAGEAFDLLVDAQILVDPENERLTEVFFGFFSGFDVHRRMLVDEIRISKYRDAINEVVKPGDVVIDAGAGTGILSVLAAKAGASKVYALEHNNYQSVIEKVASDSGVSDIVEVVSGDFGETILPEKADVLVTETFGLWAIDEGAMPDLKKCAENNLKSDGILVPEYYSLYLAPIVKEVPSLYSAFIKRPDGIDLTSLRMESKAQNAVHYLTEDFIGQSACIGKFEVLNDFIEPLRSSIRLQGPSFGLCGFFELHLTSNISLSTSPEFPKTSWKQTTLDVQLKEGQNDLQIEIGLAPENRRAALLKMTGDIEQVIRVC